MKVVALAGGTGSAKLLRGLATTVSELTVIANVGDNFWAHGLYVCPDVDISTYALAGIADEIKGWGIRGDSFVALGQLGKLGEETWFRLGDRDLATSVVRTMLLRAGRSLTEVTKQIALSFGVRQPILPATDSEVGTWLSTNFGLLHLQEYWVKNGGRPRVKGVVYRGAAKARPSPLVRNALSAADRVIVCPANPITSIGPILAIGGMRGLLSGCKAKIVALSPLVGRRPFSGPAGRLMRQLGERADSVGLAKLYAGFLDELVIDRSDASLARGVEGAGVACSLASTLMRDRSDERRLASVLLEA